MNLKTARLRANLSQADLAEKIGVSTVQISRYENGHAEPYPRTKRAIQEVLGFIQWPTVNQGETLTVDEQEQLDIVIHVMAQWLGAEIAQLIFDNMEVTGIREVLQKLKGRPVVNRTQQRESK